MDVFRERSIAQLFCTMTVTTTAFDGTGKATGAVETHLESKY